MENSCKRNEYIDFLKGIAALGIIVIHTAFWGGQSYTPEWFWNLTLFLDVPFFFYLSGWGSSYRKSDITKTCKSVLHIWLKWIFFIVVLELFCLFSKLLPVSFQGVEDVRDLVNNFMFHVSIPGFRVVAGSIWFMQYYFVVIIGNAIVLMFIEKSVDAEKLKKFYLSFLIGIFVWISYGKYLFGIDARYFTFYSIFWMLGFLRWGHYDKWNQYLLMGLLLAIGFVFTSYLQELAIYDLQSAKFPPSLKYGLASVPAILIAKGFENRIKNLNRFIVHIGNNAIFYYFAQGIGSSLNYYVINAIDIKWWFVKWCVTLIINTGITIVIAELLAFLYTHFVNIIQNMKLQMSIFHNLHNGKQ